MRGEVWIFFLFAALATLAGGLHGLFKLLDATEDDSPTTIWTARVEVALAIVTLAVIISAVWRW